MQEILDENPLFCAEDYLEASHTDITVRTPATNSTTVDTRDAKKRKRDGENGVEASTTTATSGGDGAFRYPGHIVTNKRLTAVLDVVKKQCEVLNRCCVCGLLLPSNLDAYVFTLG